MRNWVMVLLFASAALAQNTPRLAYVYPAGGRSGTTFQVEVAGQFLATVRAVRFSGGDVRGEVTGYVRPMNPQQATELREKLQELRKQPPGPATQAEIAGITRQLATFNRNRNPVLDERVTVEVTLEPGARPGRRELRLLTPQGLSNPLAFYVGDLPEYIELQSEIKTLLPGVEPDAPTPADITLPATVNGRIVPRAARQGPGQPFTPGEADRMRFHAHKGRRVVFDVRARELIPYLADAVPGWFQPTLAVFDEDGKELVYQDDYRFRPDPLLEFEIPRDGDYILEIKDALYRGREDFVYRIEARETGPKAAAGTPRSRGKGLQRIALPAIREGVIDAPAKVDVYAFNGRAGQEMVAEVEARRMGSPLDSTLELTDAAGRRIAFNDDHEDKRFGLLTHQADSWLLAKLPAAGTYHLRVGDAQRRGGPDYDYRLRVSAPKPDFDLRVTPSAVNAGNGVSVPITVYALRRDGFSGEIRVALAGAPPGVALSGGRIPAGVDQIRMTLTAGPPAPALLPMPLRLEGRAMAGGAEVVREAVPADDMMQAFAYHHLVPSDEWTVTVANRGGFRPPARVLSQLPVRIPAGGSTRVLVRAPLAPNSPVTNLRFELSEAPEGIELRDSGAEGFSLYCDAARIKPGLEGNLIVNILAERQPPAAAPGGAPPAPVRVTLGSLPAIPFEVVH